jgi:hypothetical protein
MKIKIIRDSKGEIVGTIEETSSEEARVEMELEQGHKQEEIEVSHNYLFDLDSFFKRYKQSKKP